MQPFPHPDQLTQSLAAILEPARVPGVVVIAAQADQPACCLRYGADADGVLLANDTLFPVASITKLATALTILRLVDAGEIVLDDPLTSYIPAAHGVIIESLLCHIAGYALDLRSSEAPYTLGLDWPHLAQACLAATPEAAAGTHVQYSNIGYGLLAVLVERQTNMPFATALRQLVLEPLGIEGYLGVEPSRAPARLADTRGPHANTAIDPFNSAFWRSLAMPWAGLVTNAAGALTLVRAFLGYPSGFLHAETAQRAIRDHTAGLPGGFAAPMLWDRSPWGLGPEVRGEKQPHWLPANMPHAFGHSGASGCLAWADPDTNVAWAILGSRTADSGWLLRRGPALCEAVLQSMAM
jgi:CubicO group peptidase (beta-lactamase class C family)